VTVVVNVPGYQPWVVAGWAFRTLAERASELLDRETDRLELVQAEALNGLHFDLLARDTAVRLATALKRAADDLCKINLGATDERDREFAHALGVLSLWLSDLATNG
jgi:hypothetical protein